MPATQMAYHLNLLFQFWVLRGQLHIGVEHHGLAFIIPRLEMFVDGIEYFLGVLVRFHYSL